MMWWFFFAYLTLAPAEPIRPGITYLRFGGMGRGTMNPRILIVGRGETLDAQRWYGIHCGDVGTNGGGCALVEIDKATRQGEWLRVSVEGGID